MFVGPCILQVQSLRLVLKRQTGLCQSAAHACMPYRLETAGWTAAVLSDAIAATMGRLPATTVTGLPLGSIKSWVRGKLCVLSFADVMWWVMRGTAWARTKGPMVWS